MCYFISSAAKISGLAGHRVRTRDWEMPAVFLECERGDRRTQTPQDWAPNTTFPLGVAEDTASWGKF